MRLGFFVCLLKMSLHGQGEKAVVGVVVVGRFGDLEGLARDCPYP